MSNHNLFQFTILKIINVVLYNLLLQNNSNLLELPHWHGIHKDCQNRNSRSLAQPKPIGLIVKSPALPFVTGISSRMSAQSPLLRT